MENMDKRKFRNGMIIYLLILIVAFILINRWMQSDKIEVTTTYSYTDLTEDLDDGKILALSIQPNAEIPTAVVQVQFTNGKTLAFYSTDVNDVVKIYNDYQASVDKYNATVSSDDDKKVVARCSLNDVEKTSIWSVIIPYALVMIVMFFVMLLFVRSSQGGGGQMMNFGKSRAKMTEPDEKEKEDKKNNKKKITFDDVAGLSEEKEDLEEIVCFLKTPGRFIKVGARIPKGVLLVGPPGTGKTLMAKAIAGEAGVPFFSISGSDFVEMFVGVGAARVRDLFAQAKKNAPCIVFIDEIDAVARQRGTGLGGGHDEREQTLNQLLVEMDGFGANEGIIVLAATNRVDILDKAILRPGRFDRKISVNPPDIKGREEILKLHVANKPLAEDVDLNEISRTTAGFSGADLENLMNEAAISAAKAGREYINKEDVDKSYIKVGVGGEKRSHVVSEEDRKITAYHESGHAILFHLLPYVGPVHIVSIIPTGTGAGGYTMPLPQGDQEYITKAHLLNEIKVSMGGRIAEKIIFGNFTTGASQDIKMASGYARSMVTKYGMSENLGFINYESDDQEEVFLGKNLGHTKPYSEKIAAAIDEEVKQIVDECYREAYEILEQNVDVLHKSAKLLLEKERITGAEFEALFDRDDAKDADAHVQSNGAEQSTAENVNAADNAVAEQKAETQTDKQ